MAKYLIQANLVGEGIKGLLKEGGTSRRAAVEQLFSSVGGKLEVFYFGFGETDVYVIGDVPDNVTAASLALTVGASGLVKVKTTVLLTPEEIDQAIKKNPQFRGPGA